MIRTLRSGFIPIIPLLVVATMAVVSVVVGVVAVKQSTDNRSKASSCNCRAMTVNGTTCQAYGYDDLDRKVCTSWNKVTKTVCDICADPTPQNNPPPQNNPAPQSQAPAAKPAPSCAEKCKNLPPGEDRDGCTLGCQVSNSGGSVKNIPKCQGTDSMCQGNTRYVCQNNAWVISGTCDPSVSKKSATTENKCDQLQRCSNGKMQVCNNGVPVCPSSNGVIPNGNSSACASPNFCAAAVECTSGTAAGTCVGGSVCCRGFTPIAATCSTGDFPRCTGTQRYICQNGNWVPSGTCSESLCSQSDITQAALSCVSKQAECDNGQVRCKVLLPTPVPDALPPVDTPAPINDGSDICGRRNDANNTQQYTCPADGQCQLVNGLCVAGNGWTGGCVFEGQHEIGEKFCSTSSNQVMVCGANGLVTSTGDNCSDKPGGSVCKVNEECATKYCVNAVCLSPNDVDSRSKSMTAACSAQNGVCKSSCGSQEKALGACFSGICCASLAKVPITAGVTEGGYCSSANPCAGGLLCTSASGGVCINSYSKNSSPGSARCSEMCTDPDGCTCSGDCHISNQSVGAGGTCSGPATAADLAVRATADSIGEPIVNDFLGIRATAIALADGFTYKNGILTYDPTIPAGNLLSNSSYYYDQSVTTTAQGLSGNFGGNPVAVFDQYAFTCQQQGLSADCTAKAAVATGVTLAPAAVPLAAAALPAAATTTQALFDSYGVGSIMATTGLSATEVTAGIESFEATVAFIGNATPLLGSAISAAGFGGAAAVIEKGVQTVSVNAPLIVQGAYVISTNADRLKTVANTAQANGVQVPQVVSSGLNLASCGTFGSILDCIGEAGKQINEAVSTPSVTSIVPPALMLSGK